MIQPEQAHRAVERVLVRASPASVRGLRRELGLTREAAAEIYAATAALIPSGLARRTRRRPLNGRAAWEVVKKYGRPADARAPELGIAGKLAGIGLSPRLGGLLGDAGDRAAQWLAETTGASEDATGRGMAASAPLVLGALGTALAPRDLNDWIATVEDEVLDHPQDLSGHAGSPGRFYRRLRRFARPWWRRLS